MVRVPKRDGADAVRLRPADRVLHGAGGQDLAHCVLAIHDRDRAGIDDKLRLRDGLADPGEETRHVPGQAQHAVRLVAPEIGLDQRVSREPRIGFGHSGADVDGRREVEQAVGRDAHLLIHALPP